MAGYYTFVCSLNYLDFEGEAPMSPESFKENAASWLPENELLALDDAAVETGCPAVAEYARYEFSLLSAVAQLRAQRLSREFSPDRLRCDILDGMTRQTLAELYKTGDPMKIERGLDLLRFQKLEELGAGHFFDYSSVFCYYKRLVIMWRWKCLDQKAGLEVVRAACGSSAE